MSKLIGCESFSDTAGIPKVIGVEEVDFDEDSTGMLYHLEHMRLVLSGSGERAASHSGDLALSKVSVFHAFSDPW